MCLYFYDFIVLLFHYRSKNAWKISASEADLFIIYLLSRSSNKQFKQKWKCSNPKFGFPPGVNSTGEIGLFMFRAPVNSLRQRLLLCKCQILMAKDTTRELSPQIWACVISIYPQNKSAAVVPQQIWKMQQLPFQTCKLLRCVNWNAKNNAGSLFLANCLCAACKCTNFWVPTNQQPPCWVMKAFKGPAVAQWGLQWDNNDFLSGLQTALLRVLRQCECFRCLFRESSSPLPYNGWNGNVASDTASSSYKHSCGRWWDLTPGSQLPSLLLTFPPCSSRAIFSSAVSEGPERREPDRRTLLHRTYTPGTESASIH